MEKRREMNIRDFTKLMKSYGFCFYGNAKGDHKLWVNPQHKLKFSLPYGRKVKSGIVWNFLRLVKQNNLKIA